MPGLRLLALSGSQRAASTNTALLRGLRAATPAGIDVVLSTRIATLPIFSPDLEEPAPPAPVAAFIDEIAAADGLIIASPEYVRAIPGGLKNAIDWLVSGAAVIEKPIALAHASHRGEDMLAALRVVLGTVSTRFAPDIFLSLPLMKKTPEEIAAQLAGPEDSARLRAWLQDFAAFIRSPAA